MTHIKRIDEMKVNEQLRINGNTFSKYPNSNELMKYAKGLVKKYFKYDPETYGFISGYYDDTTAYVLNFDVMYGNGDMKILVGNYSEDDARECLKNKSLYRGHIKNINAEDWFYYNSVWDCYNYEIYDDSYLELSNRKIFNELNVGVNYDYGGMKEDENVIPGYIFDDYVEKYSEIFRSIFDCELLFLGRGGSHTCIKPDKKRARDFVLYPEMSACVDELQDKMIAELEEIYGK